jgi:hypothetical protein
MVQMEMFHLKVFQDLDISSQYRAKISHLQTVQMQQIAHFQLQTNN